jgi:hypothetical protein
MKEVIKWFLYITTVITTIGVLILLNYGELDIYGIWDLATCIAAIWYINKYTK